MARQASKINIVDVKKIIYNNVSSAANPYVCVEWKVLYAKLRFTNNPRKPTNIVLNAKINRIIPVDIINAFKVNRCFIFSKSMV